MVKSFVQALALLVLLNLSADANLSEIFENQAVVQPLGSAMLDMVKTPRTSVSLRRRASIPSLYTPDWSKGPLIMRITRKVFAVRSEFILSNMGKSATRTSASDVQYRGEYNAHGKERAQLIRALTRQSRRLLIPRTWTQQEQRLWIRTYHASNKIIIDMDELWKGIVNAVETLEHEKRHLVFEKFPRETKRLLNQVGLRLMRTHSVDGRVRNIRKSHRMSERAEEIIVSLEGFEDSFEKFFKKIRFDWRAARISQNRQLEALGALNTLYHLGAATRTERRAIQQTRIQLLDRLSRRAA